MAYVDNNTPVIEKITLPSGNTYFIADREIRDVVEDLKQAVAGGVSYNVAWDGTSEPTVGNIPAGVTVTYNGTTYTGTMEANNATPGAFYLIKSATQVDEKDVYDEYVPVGPDGSKTWEKIGDTQIDLSNVVTNVSLTKQTDTVIGTDATFTVTQPTITLTANAATAAGRLKYVEDVTGGSISPTKVHLGASASGGAVSASGDSVTAITGLGTPTTQSAVKSVTPTTKKLATSSVTGVQASTTTASKATAGTAQTTATGAGTSSTTNTDWLKGVSVSNGVLTIGAATMNTQSTPQYTFSDVTVPIKAASATTVATGATTTMGSGASIVTDVSVGDTFNAVTGYASPTTDTVLGTASTFSVTNPTVTITTNGSTGPEVVGDVDDITVAPTYKYMSGSASGANTAWNNKDSVTVLKDTTDVNVTKGGTN